MEVGCMLGKVFRSLQSSIDCFDLCKYEYFAVNGDSKSVMVIETFKLTMNFRKIQSAML